MIWRWSVPRATGWLGILNGLEPYCPLCDMKLVQKRLTYSPELYWHCDRCSLQMGDSFMGHAPTLQRITEEILRSVRTGEWKDAPSRVAAARAASNEEPT